jgi:hypothetical protein
LHVCLLLESGPRALTPLMSGFDPKETLRDTKTAVRSTTTDTGAIIAQRGEQAAKNFLPLLRGAVRLDESAHTVDRAFL